MKINKLLKIVPISCLTIASTLPLVSLASCGTKIESVAIGYRSPSVEVGQTLELWLQSENPKSSKKIKATWELLDVPEALKSVTIKDDDGNVTLRVPGNIEIQKNQDITVKATAKSNDNLTATAKITVTPKGARGFLGFQSDTLEYLSPSNEPTQMGIRNEQGTKKYESEGVIDLFMLNDPELPVGWTGQINFVPLFSPGTNKVMRFFQVTRAPEGREPLTYMDGYYDGAATETIPHFKCQRDDFPTADLRVTFDCDSEVELLIHFHLWQKNPQKTNSRILYHKNTEIETKNEYEIQMEAEGTYRCNLYCPIKKEDGETGIYSDTVADIWCSGGLKEYTDYTVVWDKSTASREMMVPGLLTIEPIETQKYIDPFDLTPYWKTGFTYSFDISKMKLTKQDYEYGHFVLFRLALHDSLQEKPESFAGWVTFSVEWI